MLRKKVLVKEVVSCSQRQRRENVIAQGNALGLGEFNQNKR